MSPKSLFPSFQRHQIWFTPLAELLEAPSGSMFEEECGREDSTVLPFRRSVWFIDFCLQNVLAPSPSQCTQEDHDANSKSPADKMFRDTLSRLLQLFVCLVTSTAYWFAQQQRCAFFAIVFACQTLNHVKVETKPVIFCRYHQLSHGFVLSKSRKVLCGSISN